MVAGGGRLCIRLEVRLIHVGMPGIINVGKTNMIKRYNWVFGKITMGFAGDGRWRQVTAGGGGGRWHS